MRIDWFVNKFQREKADRTEKAQGAKNETREESGVLKHSIIEDVKKKKVQGGGAKYFHTHTHTHTRTPKRQDANEKGNRMPTWVARMARLD
mmetsp:Transcript_11007/g.21861  ORF Transcript_11007/g.21861 Transcript_11007/m.21861 type:complete len:91 (+) Transcript_11007:276-548(+)